MLVCFSAARAADIPGAKDPPFLKRYEGSTIVAYLTRSYDSYSISAPDPKNPAVWNFSPIEGQVTRIVYRVPDGHTVLPEFSEVSKKFTPDMQRAYVKLIADLLRNKLISMDLSLPNVYFKRIGGQWVAGILDVDHIVNVLKPGNSKTWDWIRKIARDPVERGLFASSLFWVGRNVLTLSGHAALPTS